MSRGANAMDVAGILAPENVRFADDVRSKKHALDVLAELLASAAGQAQAVEVLNALVARERLGSTALGASVAMPHARLPGLDRIVAAFLRLADGVDFDAPDGKPVDLLFGLLLPSGSSEQELDALRELVQRLRDPELQERLRAAEDPDALYRALTAGAAQHRRRSSG